MAEKQYSSPYDKMKVINSRDLGYTEDFEIDLVQSYEGGWVASNPKTGFAETGATWEEAARHLVENLRIHTKRQFNV